jgi:hypothetical protein
MPTTLGIVFLLTRSERFHKNLENCLVCDNSAWGSLRGVFFSTEQDAPWRTADALKRRFRPDYRCLAWMMLKDN